MAVNEFGLTAKQLAWAEAYLKHLNATQAARDAGYQGSDSVMSVVGYDNLRKPKIRAYLRDRFEKAIMTPDEILFRLGAMARGEIPTFMRRGKTTVEDFDVRAALIDLGRTYALFTDKIQIDDWRKELEHHGISASDEFEKLVAEFIQKIDEQPEIKQGD